MIGQRIAWLSLKNGYKTCPVAFCSRGFVLLMT